MPVELVRRGGELGSLERLFADSRQGRGGAALVTGSPGTGKSALLHAFTGRAAAAGALVLSALATPAETDLAYGVVGQLLSGTGPGTRGGPHPFATGPAALHDALRGLDAARPVVVVVDDVHHADEPSARCLLYLCGRLAGAGVLVVLGGQRHAAPSLPLAELLRHPRCTTLPLETLREDGVADFLRSPFAGAMEPATARRLAPHWHRFTGGSPRLLHALLDDHRGCGPVRSSRPVAGTAFRQAVAGCLRGGGQDVTRTARALAVLAERTTLTLLARFLGESERAVALSLDRLDALGLLDAGRLRHEGVRAAVLQELSAEDSRRLHSRAAHVLYDHGAEPSAVAVHLLAADAGDGAGTGPAWAGQLLAEAATHAMRSGRARRAAQFLRAAHRAHGDEPRQGGMLEPLARAEWESDPAAVLRHLPALERDLAAGRFDAGQTVAAAGLLLWHGRPAQAERAEAALGHTEWSPELAAALAHVRPGAARAHPAPDLDARAERVLASLIHGHAPLPPVAAVLATLLHAGATERARQWCALTADAERAETTSARRAVAAAVAAVVHARTGSHDAAARHAGRALALLSPAAWGIAIGMPLSAAVRAATARDAHEEAARLLRIPVPEDMFRSWPGLHYLMARGGHLLAAGSHRAALADFHACRDLLADWGAQPRGAADWRAGAAEAQRGLAADGHGGDPVAVLTRAERRVAVLAAGGCTNRAIAARLYVTPSTVEQHLTNVYRKLRLTSRADLAELVGGAARPAAAGPV
ncbi:LuxR family transcriptional regulator [Streptomyces sp. NPDC052101]|uniref:helix-turn-helix transcriptional regulator n=1 Tax=Streptomyces sp. NPDC052101 TaxID=3155763 RepID=UPI003413AC7C